MDKNQNLITMVLEYQKTKDSQLFNEIFINFQDKIEKIAGDFAKSRSIIKEDLISEMNQRLWECIETFEVESVKDLESVIFFHLRRKAIDVVRGKNGTYLEKRIPMDTTAEENAATFEAGEATQIEEYVISRIEGEIKTDQDKRQLIEALTKNTCSLTTAIVNEHLSSQKPTWKSIGDKVGIDRKKVKRAIQSLAKNYDASQYGDINAFLAV
ncbi:hypothetical protein [Bacillus spizizenii]|uniref:hypothetical protein n=1 Tax=Bacillus spizizenii TaxID=96241 RepID=UPI002FC8CE2A